MLYQTSKNLYFTKLDKTVLAGDVIELETTYANEVNEQLKAIFPDVDKVLVAVDEPAETADEPAEEEVKPKKTGRKSKPAE